MWVRAQGLPWSQARGEGPMMRAILLLITINDQQIATAVFFIPQQLLFLSWSYLPSFPPLILHALPFSTLPSHHVTFCHFFFFSSFPLLYQGINFCPRPGQCPLFTTHPHTHIYTHVCKCTRVQSPLSVWSGAFDLFTKSRY